jgi:hypothetical protein
MGARIFPQRKVNLNHPAHRSSVFDRIIWPQRPLAAHSDSQHHLEAVQQSIFENSDQRRNGHNWREGGVQNLKDKGKQLMEEPSIPKACCKCARAGSGFIPCHSWTVCYSCGQKGHIAHHCLAQWKVSA